MTSAIEIVSLNVVHDPQNGQPTSIFQDICLTISAGQLVGLVGSEQATRSSLLKVIAGQLEPTSGRVRVNGFDVVTQRDEAQRQVELFQGVATHTTTTRILIVDEPDKSTAWRAWAQAREQGQTLLLSTSQPAWAAALCERVLVLESGRLAADLVGADLKRELKGEHYRIQVRGRLPQDWSDWFSGLQVTAGGADTILDGYLPDQGALHSVLGAIRNLNLPLLNVQYIEPDIRELIDRLHCKP
ncbi:MAG TPA: ATP-binding cassette domain-containing protein [Aggregatilineales bacterium]|nr:ATP-binding cassette domain-containing protein [Aggregatilineales bacterium]